MNNMNILKCALPAAALLMASSCTFQQEDYFDESASLRIEHTNDQIRQYLCDSVSHPHGWLIQYFVAGTDEMDFEGFNLFGRFSENGRVTLGSDHGYLRNGKAGLYTEYSSVYELLREESCVLSFSTWNDILSVFVDPVDPSSAPTSLVDDGEGMHGDDRLVMLSYDENQMTFRGERHSARVYFQTLDRTPQQYISDVDSMKLRFATAKVYEYSVNAPDSTFYLTGLYNGVFQFVDRLDDPLASSTQSCVFTPTGFKLEYPRTIKDQEVQEFTLNADETALTCGDVTIRPEWMRTVSRMLAGNRKVDIITEGSSEAYQSYFNALAEGVKGAFASQSLHMLTFGSSNESSANRRTGIVFYIQASSDKLVGFTAKLTANGETVTIEADPEDHSSNFNNYDKKGIGSLFTDFVKALNGTYSLKPNSVFYPTNIIWTKVDDPSFYFNTVL